MNCPICGEEINNFTATEHLTGEHGFTVCGVAPEGISLKAVKELTDFYKKLKGENA